MSYKIVPTPEFIKQTRKLAKKNRTLANDLSYLQELLKENPNSGVHLGNNCYKIRIPNSSNKKGKSGGYRVITYVIANNKIIRLLAIYSKSEKNSIPDEEIQRILKNNHLL